MKLINNHPFGVIAEATEAGTTLLDIPKSDITDWLDRHQLVIFRGFDELENEPYLQLARSLGTPLAWEFGEVLDLRIMDNPPNHIFNAGRLELHWDGCYLDVEPRYNLFQCIQGAEADSGGKTLFVNGLQVWDKLSEQEKTDSADIRIVYSTEKKAHYGGTLRAPLFDTNPFNQRKVVRYIEAFNEDSQHINPTRVSVEGMSPSQSDEFLRTLNARLYKDDVMYRHTWRSGDFLIADNSSLLHGRSRFESPNCARYIKRINIV